MNNMVKVKGERYSLRTTVEWLSILLPYIIGDKFRMHNLISFSNKLILNSSVDEIPQ